MRVGEVMTISFQSKLITIERTAHGYTAWFYDEPLFKVKADTQLGVIGKLFNEYPKDGKNAD